MIPNAMPAQPQKTTTLGRLIGYAHVSTEEQGTDPQHHELHARRLRGRARRARLRRGPQSAGAGPPAARDPSRRDPGPGSTAWTARSATCSPSSSSSRRWHPSSVKHLLARAQRLGLAGTAPAQIRQLRASRGAQRRRKEHASSQSTGASYPCPGLTTRPSPRTHRPDNSTKRDKLAYQELRTREMARLPPKGTRSASRLR
jgi:hypothetical protein